MRRMEMVLTLISAAVAAVVLAMIAVAVAVALGLLFHLVMPVHARPNPAWQAQRIQAEQGDDYETLRRLKYLSTAGEVACIPGTFCLNGATKINCCGEADAYETDDTFVDARGTWAVLTCNDPQDCREVSGKVVRKPGERYLIPPDRVLLKDRPTNNTGHGWIWLNANGVDIDGSPTVLCWTPGAGG